MKALNSAEPLPVKRRRNMGSALRALTASLGNNTDVFFYLILFFVVCVYEADDKGKIADIKDIVCLTAKVLFFAVCDL